MLRPPNLSPSRGQDHTPYILYPLHPKPCVLTDGLLLAVRQAYCLGQRRGGRDGVCMRVCVCVRVCVYVCLRERDFMCVCMSMCMCQCVCHA